MRIKVETNHAQRRLKTEAITTAVDGTAWDLSTVDNVWVEPTTLTALLLPSPLDHAFDNTFAGRYARLRLTDFQHDAAIWKETVGGKGAGDYWLESKGVITDNIITSADMKPNAGMWFGWFAYNPNTAREANEIEAGWVRANAQRQVIERLVTFRFKTGGKVEVFEGERFVREYSLGGKQRNSEEVDAESSEAGEQITQDFTFVMILPFRNREILLVGASGRPVTHTLEYLPEDWQGDIIPSGWKFGFGFVGTTAKLQAAHVRFPTSGVIRGKPVTFVKPPTSEQTSITYHVVTSHTDKVSAALKDLSGATYSPPKGAAYLEFTINAVTVESGIGITSPFVYGGQAMFPAVHADTDDSAVSDITANVRRLSFSGDENSIGVTADLALDDVDTVKHAWQPVRILFDDGVDQLVWFDGVFLEEASSQRLNFDESRFTVKDRWAFAENYLPPDPDVWDGRELASVVTRLADIAGVQADAPATGFTIPVVGSNSGRMQAEAEVGTTPADSIERVKETYAQNFFVYMSPGSDGYKLRFKETLPTTPAITLYSTIAAAEGAGATFRQVYRAFSKVEHAPEVTQIWIQGREPHSGKPILAVVRHADPLEDVTLAPASRPDLWTGFPRRYGYTDPALVSVTLLRRAASLLAPRLFKKRVQIEVRTHLQVKTDGYPVWLGDVIRLVDGATTIDFRVQRMTLDIRRVESDVSDWRFEECVYAGEVI